MLKTRYINRRQFEQVLLGKEGTNVRYSSLVPTSNSQEYTENPEYPEVVSVKPKATENRQKEAYYDKIKKLPTVEEKLFVLNLPRYYGWPCYVVKEGVIPYNFLPFAQYVTRTFMVETDKIPVQLTEEKADRLIQKIKPHLEKALVFENYSKKYRYEIDENQADLSDSEINDLRAKHVIQQINRVLLNNLVSEYSHLLRTQVDYEPRLESFWRVGGFYPNQVDKDLRKIKLREKHRLNESIDRCIQYFGSPVLQLRSRLPLLPFQTGNGTESQLKPMTESDTVSGNTESSIQSYRYDPSDIEYPIQSYKYDPSVYLGIPRERMHAVTTPGFWPNDPFQYGILSYHCRGHAVDRPLIFGDSDHKEALHCQAILASYAWLLAQASYQGFSIFYDLTYPMTTQTIITDGKVFSFYNYQLNTTVLHSNKTKDENPLKNDCYGTAPQELYHSVENNKITGWNDAVLSNLISFYVNTPSKREGVDMKPYLSKEQQLLSHIPDEKRRAWLHDSYRYIASRRPRHRLAPEIYDWERIFKIQFKRRTTDARKKFFERFKDPFNNRLDEFQDPINDRLLSEHTPPYIPKKFRAPGKFRKKWEDTYYPDVYPEYPEVV